MHNDINLLNEKTISFFSDSCEKLNDTKFEENEDQEMNKKIDYHALLATAVTRKNLEF